MAAPTISTSEIEARARRRADMENSDFIGSAELTQYCEKAFQEFIGILITKEPDLMTKRENLVTVAGTAEVSLPAGFKALRRLKYTTSFSLRRAELQELEVLTFNGRRAKPTHYWLSGIHTGAATVTLMPIPDAVYALHLYHIPSISLADVTGGGLNMVAGWDEYVVLTAAMKMKDKEESDVSVLLGERKLLLDNIVAQVTAQDTGEPGRIATFSPNPFYNDPFDIEDRYGL